MRHYSGSRPQARRKAGAEARSKGKTPGASPDPRRGDRRRSSGIRARLVRNPRRIIRPGPVQVARHGKTAGGRAKRLRAARPPHATPTSIQSIFNGRINASDRWRALKTPTARRQNAPRARTKKNLGKAADFKAARPFDSPAASYKLRLRIGFGRTRAPARPPPWPMGSTGRRHPTSVGRASKRNGFRLFRLGEWVRSAPHSVAPHCEGGRKRKKLRAPSRSTPQAGPRAAPPHPTGFHGRQSLKAEGRALAPIDRSEKNRERFGRWAVSAATAPGDRNPTGTPQAGPAPAERFGALCPAAGKRRAGRPSPTPSPSPSRPGSLAAPLAVEPIGLGEVEPKRAGERPCGHHPRPPAQPAASPRAAAIDSAKQARPDAKSNG